MSVTRKPSPCARAGARALGSDRRGVVAPGEQRHLRATVGTLLEASRREAGWSRTALARAVGASSATPGRIERGERRPRPAMLADLAAVLSPGDGGAGLAAALCAAAGRSLVADTRAGVRARSRARRRAQLVPQRVMARGALAQQRATRQVLAAIGSALSVDELAGRGESFRAVCRAAERECARAREVMAAVERWPHAPLRGGCRR